MNELPSDLTGDRWHIYPTLGAVPATVTDCPVCDGEGCTECGETGRRVTTWLELDGGEIKMRVQGNAILTEADKAALAELGRAAYEQMGEKRSTDE